MTIHRDLTGWRPTGWLQGARRSHSRGRWSWTPHRGRDAPCAVNACPGARPDHHARRGRRPTPVVPIAACCCCATRRTTGGAGDRFSTVVRWSTPIRAVYVMDSEVGLCCVPGVLCFATSPRRRTISRGVCGRRLTYDEAFAGRGRRPPASLTRLGVAGQPRLPEPLETNSLPATHQRQGIECHGSGVWPMPTRGPVRTGRRARVARFQPQVVGRGRQVEACCPRR